MNAAHCPSCALSARPQAWDDVTAFKCEGCHGHFIPGPALQDFLEKHSEARAHSRLLEKAIAAKPTARPLTCPHCRTRSYCAVQVGVVELDVCSTCGGVFLDQGEALLYFRQVRDQPIGERLVDGFEDTTAGTNIVIAIGNFISKLIH